ncbi:MAG: DUF2079 domain-containing protein [Oscillospiraceae bacterium]|nr:DUF2079 domain-containing protein [Oscillospiraceae bacterium]
MEQKKSIIKPPNISATIQCILVGWLGSVLIEYLINPGPLNALSTLSEMSLLRVLLTATAFTALLLLLQIHTHGALLRWALFGIIVCLSALTLIQSFSSAYLVFCILTTLLVLVYALKGANSDSLPQPYTGKKVNMCIWITVVLSVGFFLVVSIWTVCRVKTFSTPSYDFGIFSQMFYNMKESGMPITTLERDGLLSHFKVHMSPIYYLLLPFYCIVPKPATLQVLQAAILVSAVIPLWLLGKQHGLSPWLRMLTCALLLLYPAYSGGTSYDIHENAFLTPLILWLFYALDSRKGLLTALFTVLVLMVKEDAAVYTAVIGLFVLLRSVLGKKENSQTLTGMLILIGSVAWFLIVTGYLSKHGDGVMTYRYKNFIYDGSGSLFTVIKAVVMCPMKALYECADGEKLEFIKLTILPLLALPFLTRRYERFLLLIPYFLINLMSDYQYQHDIFFQYTYGATACLFYLVVVNLADIKATKLRLVTQTTAVAVSLILLCQTVAPVAVQYPKKYLLNRSNYLQTQQLLDTIPSDAAVTATTFYTTPLSQRSLLYDVRYTSKETILGCDYVVLTTTSQSCYEQYASDGVSGFDNLVSLLLENGFTLDSQLDDNFQIYRKA